MHDVGVDSYSSGSQLFLFKRPFMLCLRAWGNTVNFLHPPPLLSPLLLSPPLQQLGGLGALQASQRSLGWSPSRQRILEYSTAKSDRFDMLREIFQHSKQQEMFRFSPRII